MVNGPGAMRMSQHSNGFAGLRTMILHFPQRLSHGRTTVLSQNRQQLSLLLVRVCVILRCADQPSGKNNRQRMQVQAAKFFAHRVPDS